MSYRSGEPRGDGESEEGGGRTGLVWVVPCAAV